MKQAVQLLAVEDDPAVQRLIASVADSIGVAFQGVRTITEASTRIIDKPPDAIILDGMLPDGTGLDFLQTLREQGVAVRWVVFLSAYFKDFAAYQQLKALGVDVVLHKPITPESLTGELRQLFGKRAAQAAQGVPPGFAKLCAEYADRLPGIADELELTIQKWQPGKPAPDDLIQSIHRLAGSAGSYQRPEVSKAAASCEKHMKASLSPEGVTTPWKRLVELLRQAPSAHDDAPKADPLADRIAILTDGPQASRALKVAFEAAGFGTVATSLEDVGAAADVDGVIVDASGSDSEQWSSLLSRLRPAGGPEVPVLVLTDDDDLRLRVEGSRIAGLSFLSKRLATAELVRAAQDLFALPADGSKVLVVDDDPSIFELAQAALAKTQVEPLWAPEPEAFWKSLRGDSPNVVLMDLNLPVYSGLELVRVMKADARFAQIPVLMLTASRTERVAEQSAELGVPCLAKPIEPSVLRRHILACVRRSRQVRGNIDAMSSAEECRERPTHFEGLVGDSAVMAEVGRRIGLAAQSDVTVLITGESGTGKELAARALHARSRRREGPFVAINCGAIAESLLESELFGHVRGAFTGANQDRAGLMESASGGTVFLDEIEAISPAFQVKLLRVLQEREVRRVGSNATRAVDTRVVAATNRQLETLVANGEIREDFYYRVRVFEIRLPPLRARDGDLPLLIHHVIDQLNGQQGRAVRDVSAAALEAVQRYGWPGNVRQLRNAIEHAFVTVNGDVIQLDDLPPELREIGMSTSEISAPTGSLEPLPTRSEPLPVGPAGEDEAAALGAADERQEIITALRATGGNRTRAAKRLGYSRVTLWKKVRHFAIDIDAILEI